MRKAIAILALLACNAVTLNAQDFDLGTIGNPTAVIAKNKPWSQFNAVYLFRPLAPQISLYIFVRNNNPANGHPLTVRVYQTPDTTLTSWTNTQGRWVEDSVQGNAGAGCTTTVAADTTVACYVVTMFAAKIAIRITGAGALAGSPDTGDLYIIQTVGEPKGQQMGSGSQSVMGVNADGTSIAGILPVLIAGMDNTANCGGSPCMQNILTAVDGTLAVGAFDTPSDNEGNSAVYMKYGAAGAGQQFPLGTFPFVFDGTTWDRQRGDRTSGAMVSDTWELQTVADKTNEHTGVAYNQITNPGAGLDILNVTRGANGLAAHDLVISATATSRVDIHIVSDAGATCTGLTIRSWTLNNAAPAGTASHSCTTDPASVAVIMTVVVPANGTLIIDLRSMRFDDAASGVSLRTPAAITGIVSASLQIRELAF